MPKRPYDPTPTKQCTHVSSACCPVCKKPKPHNTYRVAHQRCLDIKGRTIRHNPEYFAELRAMPHNKFKTDEEIYWEYIY